MITNNSTTDRKRYPAFRCPKCGKRMDSLVCNYCGRSVPSWQVHLHAVAASQVAILGGHDLDDNDLDGDDFDDYDGDRPIKQNGRHAAEPDSLQNTETPPSLCRWIFERLVDAGVHPKVILDPCSGRGNLTRPFPPETRVIEYEIQHGKDFFAESKKIVCDLTICNPPWSWAGDWLRHIVRRVGRETPLVFIAPALFFTGYKDGEVRKYLESDEAPTLHHITPLPSDTFVKVYSPGAVLWFNLPKVRDVAFVPNRYLIRSNDAEA